MILKAVEQCIDKGLDKIVVGRGEDYFINAMLTGRQDRIWLKVYKNNLRMRLLRDAEFKWAPALKRLKSRLKGKNIEGVQPN